MILLSGIGLSGTAPFMGELAEQWTAQELRPLSKHGWRLVNFALSYGDQDHVLVGPGGVVLLETKWNGTPWDLDDRDYFFRRALNQALDHAARCRDGPECSATGGQRSSRSWCSGDRQGTGQDRRRSSAGQPLHQRFRSVQLLAVDCVEVLREAAKVVLGSERQEGGLFSERFAGVADEVERR